MEDGEIEERDLGVMKKKRDRAESPCSLTTDSETVNEDVENGENDNDRTDVVSTPPPSSTNATIVSSLNTTVSI